MSGPHYPLLFSGRDAGALREQAARWAQWLEAHPTLQLNDLLHTAALRRMHFDERAALQVTSIPEATAALKALAQGASHEAVYTARARGRGRVVFVFPGRGSHRPAMGRALLAESPAFAEAIQSCDDALQPLLGWSVTSVLRGDSVEGAEDLERTDVVQPLLFAMAVGLASLWRSLGMRPAAVVGHSQGEVPAAVVAGALTLEEGARVVVARSRLVCRLAGKGGMAVMELPFEEVQQRLKPWADALEIAVVNTPTSTVVSGDLSAIEELVASMEPEDVFCRKVNVDYASHCAHVDEVVPELLDALADITPGETSVPFYSAVTGEVVPGSSLDADYWCRNLRETVRMDKALGSLMADGFGVLIEVSPHPILAMPLTMASMESKGVVVGTLERDAGGMPTLYRALGMLHAQGARVPWPQVLADLQAEPVLLPTYAFQRRSYWLEGSADYAAQSGSGWTPGAIPVDEDIAHGGLRAELMDLPEDERPAAVTEVICTEMAVVMGIENPSEIPVDKPLKELGMDSLRILECRNRIVSRIEMDIAVEWVFKYPTPESLGAHLAKELTTAAPAPTLPDAPLAEVATDAPLWERYLHRAMDKVMEGDEQEGSELLKTSAVLRGHEEQISHYPLTPEPMSPLTMAEGSTPALFFIPAFPPTGVLQYAQIAPHLEGTREMQVTGHPGYQSNETLLTWDALITAHADAILKASPAGPIVLVGHSAGGWVSMGVVGLLRATEPTRQIAVVLLDSPPPPATIRGYDYPGFFVQTLSEVVTGNMDTVALDPAQLAQALHDPFGWSAATWYSQRGFEFVPPTVDVPVLLVRAREENPLLNVESVPETIAHALGWERFAPSLTVVDVDGTHFSMVHDPHAEALCEAIEAWLSEVL